MTARHLHFTLGPVQGFIDDARRLRDYWAGSFILSLLSGHAMAAAGQRSDTEIAFPLVESDPLYQAISSNDRTADVYVGSLPNRFKAEVPKDHAENIALACRDAVMLAWAGICDTVWRDYVEPAALQTHGTAPGEPNPTKVVWDRQTLGFWEIAWAIGDADDTSGAWLDMRKNWRRLNPDCAEDGDLCRLMGQWQELSGVIRFSPEASERQQLFWRLVREQPGVGELDLPDGEYLCAMALIKRLFPVHLQRHGGSDIDRPGGPGFPGAIAWQPGGGGLNIRHWPSTSYIAALPWLKLAGNTAKLSEQDRDRFYLTAFEVVQENANPSTDAPGIMGETATSLFRLPNERFYGLDGHLFHQAGIAAFVKERFADQALSDPAKAQSRLHDALLETCKKLGRAGEPLYPSAFYAILRMDGDRIGELLRKREPVVGKGLAAFTDAVKQYFDPAYKNPSPGTLVYAGGDDVLAILPIDTAIRAARDIRDLYSKSFETILADKDEAGNFTLSASIVFSHFKSPLSAALRLSKEQLDDIAKTKNGRNSVALCVAKPGGVAAQWVSVFGERACPNSDAALQIDDVARRGLTGPRSNAMLSGSFLHGLRDRYLAIMPGEHETRFGNIDSDALLQEDGDLFRALIGADLRRQFGSGMYRRLEEAPPVDEVCRILRPLKRCDSGSPVVQDHVAFDGGLIVRFLAMESRQNDETTGETVARTGGDDG